MSSTSIQHHNLYKKQSYNINAFSIKIFHATDTPNV